MAAGAALAAALAPACTAKLAGFPLGWGAAFPLALGAASNFFGGTKSLGIHFSSNISRVKYSFPSNRRLKPQTPRALFAHTTSTSLPSSSSSSSSLLEDRCLICSTGKAMQGHA